MKGLPPQSKKKDTRALLRLGVLEEKLNQGFRGGKGGIVRGGEGTRRALHFLNSYLSKVGATYPYLFQRGEKGSCEGRGGKTKHGV